MAPANPATSRRRNKKRKRRAASSSSSSSSSDDDDSSSQSGAPIPPPRLPAPVADVPSSPSTDPESSSEDDSPDPTHPGSTAKPLATTQTRSPTPDRAPVPLPHFVSSNAENEPILRERFRKFWMSSMADAFSEDLGEIRTEPNLTTSRLALLIDSLAAGADVFTSSTGPDANDINEMDVIMSRS